MTRLAVCTCVVIVLVCYADAASKTEVLDVITKISSDARQTLMDDLRKTIVQTRLITTASSPIQRLCAVSQIRQGFADIKDIMDMVTNDLKNEYGNLDQDILAQLPLELVTAQVTTVVQEAAQSLGGRSDQIKDCLNL